MGSFVKAVHGDPCLVMYELRIFIQGVLCNTFSFLCLSQTMKMNSTLCKETV